MDNINNMNVEEKSNELIKRFNPFTYTAVHSHKTPYEYADAIQCTLVAVNEIISALKLMDPNNTSGLIGFWNDVKLYIEKK